MAKLWDLVKKKRVVFSNPERVTEVGVGSVEYSRVVVGQHTNSAKEERDTFL